MEHNLLLAIGGATGSGKTALAIELAHTYPELVILSADSRQIYKRLDIGSAKLGVAGTDDSLTGQLEPVWIYESIPQFLIDIAEPASDFSVADYQQEAYRLINACWEKGRTPLIVGGSGLYIRSVMEGYIFEGAGQESIRKQFQDLPSEVIHDYLRERGVILPEPEAANRRRLIRAAERLELGLDAKSNERKTITDNAHTFILTRDWPEQQNQAPEMVRERLDLGLIDETNQLLKDGIDKTWLQSMGLSYRLVIAMLDGEFSEEELETKMIHAFRQLMRRQRTWFKQTDQAVSGSREEVSRGITALLTIHTPSPN